MEWTLLKRTPDIMYTVILTRLNKINIPDDNEDGYSWYNYVTKEIIPKVSESRFSYFDQYDMANRVHGVKGGGGYPKWKKDKKIQGFHISANWILSYNQSILATSTNLP